MQGGGPEAVRENDRARRTGAVVALVEQAAEHGMQAHDFEVVAAHHAGAHFPRIAQPVQREADGGELAQGTQGPDALAEILHFRDGEDGIFFAEPAGALADIDQAFLVAVHERTQENAADQSEDGRVGADTERECQHHGNGEAFGSGEGSDGTLHVVPEDSGSFPKRQFFSVHRKPLPAPSQLCRFGRRFFDIRIKNNARARLRR